MIMNQTCTNKKIILVIIFSLIKKKKKKKKNRRKDERQFERKINKIKISRKSTEEDTSQEKASFNKYK